MKKILLIAFSVAMLQPSHAASLALSDMPYYFFTRIIQGEFQVNIVDGALQSSFETDGFAAYPYLSDNGVGFLLDYDVAPGSTWIGGGSGAVELGGSVFVGVSLIYDLSVDGHAVDVYFDKLNPDVSSSFFFSGLPYSTMIMDGEALAVGQATHMRSGEPDYLVSGNMIFTNMYGEDEPYICIECSFDFEFNFLYLDFSTGFLNFDPEDPRTLLMTGQDSYDTSPYGWGLDINVRNVPLPGAFVLMASALVGLGRFAGQRSFN